MSRRLNIEPFPVRAKLQERGFAGGGKEFYAYSDTAAGFGRQKLAGTKQACGY